jgi:hypothetical protein
MEVVYPTPKAPDSEAVLWRYMPGDYFVKMLEHFSDHDLWWKTNGQKKDYSTEPGQMWFSYPSAFEDHFEGTFPDWNRDPEKYWEHLAIEDSLTPEEVARRRSMVKANEAEAVRKNILSAAELTGVSCWTTKPADGEGLWEIVEGGDCVAIRSTCGGILDSLAKAHCSPVKLAKPAASHVAYINHAEYFIKHDGCRILLALMRTKHTDEAEVRFFANSPSLASLPTELKFPGLLSGAEAAPSKEEIFEAVIQRQMMIVAEHERLLEDRGASEGFYLPIKLDLVLHEVVFGFGCSPQFRSKIEQSLQRLGLENNVLSERRK